MVQPDHVYVIYRPNRRHDDRRGGAAIEGADDQRGQHMPIDNFFRSLAEKIGQRAIGVVLSGTASDGTEGCRAIKQAGGLTFAQDEESAKYDSMPRSAVHAGCIDFILTPKDIARELGGIGQHPYVTHVLSRPEDEFQGMEGGEVDALFGLLRGVPGVDFTNYKHSTLRRGYAGGAWACTRFQKPKDYLLYIAKRPEEVDELYRDLLINVTGFFASRNRSWRCGSMFILTCLKGASRTRRCGCGWQAFSTGEEAYSIAITLLEYLWTHTRNISQAATAIQIFATDISEASLDRARSGFYTKAAVANISAERLKRFFVPQDGGFQVNKSIREMCIFARQNLVKDPPFSNLDLVSCRNLLIYLGPLLQRRVIPTLHYALKPDGYLMLGDAESLAGFGDYFSLVDKKDKSIRSGRPQRGCQPTSQLRIIRRAGKKTQRAGCIFRLLLR